MNSGLETLHMFTTVPLQHVYSNVTSCSCSNTFLKTTIFPTYWPICKFEFFMSSCNLMFYCSLTLLTNGFIRVCTRLGFVAHLNVTPRSMCVCFPVIGRYFSRFHVMLTSARRHRYAGRRQIIRFCLFTFRTGISS